MMTTRKALVSIALTLLISWLLTASAQQLPSSLPPSPPKITPGPERFEGTLRENEGNPGYFVLKINEWSTDEEFLSLATELKASGQKGVVARLAKMKPKGVFKFHGIDGLDMIVARSIMMPSGERLVQSISNRDQPLRSDLMGLLYLPFTIIEIRIDPKGKGRGRVLVAAGITFGPDGIVQTERHSEQTFELFGVTSKREK
jgi:hypothetical protein